MILLLYRWDSDPSVAATKSVRVLENGDGFLGVGDAVEYTIVVENTGNAVLSDVSSSRQQLY